MFLADFIFAVSHLKNTLLISRVQCHRSIVSISQVRNFFSWAFPGSEIFSRGYFVSPKFFSWVFRWSEINSRGYFMGTIFFSWVFHGSKNFSREYFVGPKFCHRIPFLEKKKNTSSFFNFGSIRRPKNAKLQGLRILPNFQFLVRIHTA